MGQTFKMFDEAQIKEFKEIFGFLDQDGNGVIEVDDLVALHGIMGKPADEAALGAMIAEAPGPLDFQMLLQLFGEKMSGTDPEETIMAGWHLFDPSASGEMGVDAVKSLLSNRLATAEQPISRISLLQATTGNQSDLLREKLSHDARFINKDLGRISNNNNIINLSATMKWNLDHQEPRFPIPRGSFLTKKLFNSRENRVNNT